MKLHLKSALSFFVLVTMFVVFAKYNGLPLAATLIAHSETNLAGRRLVGPVAKVAEAESEMQFIARVDTGAKTCSLHAAEKKIEGASKYMEDNLGKIVRFRIENRRGESQWLERPIAEVREIRTSEGEEMRYLVPMQLACQGVQREVLVSLNDRSQMNYTMLLGRNFLAGEFVVDVTVAEGAQKLLARSGSP